MSLQVQGGLVLLPDREVPVLAFPYLAAQDWLIHGITTRLGGVSLAPYNSLNLSFAVGDRQEDVLENRARANRAIAMGGTAPVHCRQSHGSNVAVVDGTLAAEAVEADALVTTRRGRMLFMTFADCVPIILVDSTVPVVGLVHAGWRGSVAAIAVRAWETLQRLGARARSTVAYLGPAICRRCYEVGREVADNVAQLGPPGEESLDERAGHLHVDLPGLNGSLLEECGIRVVFSHLCTACRPDLLFSHRGDGGRTGRFGVYVGLA